MLLNAGNVWRVYLGNTQGALIIALIIRSFLSGCSVFRKGEIVLWVELILRFDSKPWSKPWFSCNLLHPGQVAMWGASVWMTVNRKICVSMEVSVGSEEYATSVFLCQGSLRFLLGKQADLWEQLKYLEKSLLVQRSGVCILRCSPRVS